MFFYSMFSYSLFAITFSTISNRCSGKLQGALCSRFDKACIWGLNIFVIIGIRFQKSWFRSNFDTSSKDPTSALIMQESEVLIRSLFNFQSIDETAEIYSYNPGKLIVLKPFLFANSMNVFIMFIN